MNIFYKIRFALAKTHYSFDIESPDYNAVLGFKIIDNKIVIVSQLINTELETKEK